MLYQKLFKQAGKQKITAGLIGAGHYGTAVVTQSFYTPHLSIPVVVDSNLEAAKNAFRYAGVNDADIVVCETREDVLRAMESGKYAAAQDPGIIMDTPLDVIVEGTGNPEVGAQNVLAAIEHGKHVAMVNKETDSVVGPILNYKARQAGLVYTPVDGDQHGLLMGMISWAETIGLNVISAGKARDVEYIYDPGQGVVMVEADGVAFKQSYRVEIPADKRQYFEFIAEGKAQEYAAQRAAALREIPRAQPFDLCEMTIVANATGLDIDTPELHNPIVGIAEIPEVLSLKDSHGGILGRASLDVVTCLRGKHDPGLGGGVFIVVSCENDYSRHILINKGTLANRAGSAALIYRPYHLCGVETATSILAAGLLNLSTGSDSYVPRYDMVRIADTDLRAGTVIGNDHDTNFRAAVVEAVKVADRGPVPAHMLNGLKLIKDAAKDTVITFDMVEAPKGSVLWQLRSEQDKLFA